MNQFFWMPTQREQNRQGVETPWWKDTSYLQWTGLNRNGRIVFLVDNKRKEFVGRNSLPPAKKKKTTKKTHRKPKKKERYDHQSKLWSKDHNERSNILKWLPWSRHRTSTSPYSCPSSHRRFFVLLQKTKVALCRLTLRRWNWHKVWGFFDVISRDRAREYLAGGKYTITDFSFTSWMTSMPIDLTDYPGVKSDSNPSAIGPPQLLVSTAAKGGRYERMGKWGGENVTHDSWDRATKNKIDK